MASAEKGKIAVAVAVRLTAGLLLLLLLLLLFLLQLLLLLLMPLLHPIITFLLSHFIQDVPLEVVCKLSLLLLRGIVDGRPGVDEGAVALEAAQHLAQLLHHLAARLGDPVEDEQPLVVGLRSPVGRRRRLHHDDEDDLAPLGGENENQDDQQ